MCVCACVNGCMCLIAVAAMTAEFPSRDYYRFILPHHVRTCVPIWHICVYFVVCIPKFGSSGRAGRGNLFFYLFFSLMIFICSPLRDR